MADKEDLEKDENEEEDAQLRELPDIVEYLENVEDDEEEEEEEEEEEKFVSIFDTLDAPRELPEPEPLTHKKLKEARHKLGLIKFCWEKIIEPKFEGRTNFLRSYSENSDKEKLLLYYAENFRLQFKHVCPNRKELFLAADNEVGLQKMVCSTISVTTLSYPEVQSWKDVATFVGEYVDYEPLADPIRIPPRLYSPHTVFLRHAGHSFETSTALVSLLLALNYDAYVVSGYATEDISKRIMMRIDSPFPEEIEEEVIVEEVKIEGKYALKPVRELKSKFLQFLEQREIDRVNEKKRIQAEENRKLIEEMEKPPPDPLEGSRVHGWVLILPSRDVKEPIFIESSTGYSYPINSCFYTGIESIWNDTNYWINMQQEDDDVLEEEEEEEEGGGGGRGGRGGGGGIGSIDYNLNDITKWEHFLIGEPTSSRQIDFPADMDEEERKLSLIMCEKHLDVLPTWCQKIDIPHKVFRRRFPKGKKETMFKRTIVEEFSDHAQVSGMVAKIRRFDDLECTPSEERVVEELYQHREDFLVKKVKDCKSDLVIEYFRDGREDCCKQHTYHTKSNTLESDRVIEYYHNIRNDCLYKLEMDDTHITEHFIGREDKFYYRHITFAKKGKPPPGMLEVKRRIIMEIIEKFERNLNVDASNDVAIRTFDLIGRKIHLKYHYGKDNVTASIRHYIKPPVEEMGEMMRFADDMTYGYQADVDSTPLRKLQLYLLFEQLIKDEEKSLLHIKELEDQIMEFIKLRFKETVHPKLRISLFDRDYNEHLMIGMREQEEREQETKKKELVEEVDFLFPYIAKLGCPKQLTLTQAQLVRSQCLNEFKQYLVRRINEVQKFYEKTKVDIEEKQKKFALAQDVVSLDDEEDFYSALNDLFFLARCLEIRLQRYRELSPHRYAALEDYLNVHPALAILR